MDTKSVYKYAAESGVPVGLYLICISTCFLLSLKVGLLQMLILPLVIGFPFLLGYRMKRLANMEPQYNRFYPLWLFGIYSVIFGTLICMLYSSLYLVFIDPSFISNYVAESIEGIKALPSSEHYEATIEVLQKAIDSHMLPSGTQFVTSMGWFTAFGGAMMSLVLALVISRMSAKKRVSMFR